MKGVELMDKFLEGSEKIHADGRLKKRVRGMVLRHRFGRAAKTVGCSAAALRLPPNKAAEYS